MGLLTKPKEHFWHTIEGVRFRIRNLTGPEQAEMFDHAEMVGGRVKQSTGSAMVAAVKRCLSRWDGLCEDDGTPVPFVNDDTKLDRLSPAVIGELFAEIYNASNLSEEDAGNSSSPTSSGVGDADMDPDAPTEPTDVDTGDATE